MRLCFLHCAEVVSHFGRDLAHAAELCLAGVDDAA